ncbi:MAG: hypothetical protein M1815_001393 [Lichina confinis]|nr:MAG: hypothetical protein M1815_001393 [Lichina confinis]
MDNICSAPGASPSGDGHRHGSGRENGYGIRSIRRRESDLSSASFMGEVEMAHDEVFAGPMSESVPTSVASFSHRRPRAGSMASFTYMPDNEQPGELLSVDDDYENDDDNALMVEDEVELPSSLDEEVDIPFDDLLPSRSRRSSRMSRSSLRDPLLGSLELTRTTSAGSGRGRRTVQKIYIVTEDLTIVFAGFSTSPNQWGEIIVQDVQQRSYGKTLSTVFGEPEEKSPFIDDDDDDDPVLNNLRFVEYRYIRFWFHPLRDRFVLGHGWRDPGWTDVKSLREGLEGDEKAYRAVVFGTNSIEIEQMSIPQLLVQEAVHPFYVFQIASLILWSLDSYYYYATCIFIISVFSIATTIVETKTTMARLREMSRFECDVRVLRSGFWRYVTSAELVPGDVYEVTDPSLTQFPADSLLLSGDCIVNESMLTGESVPVSKLPATDETLAALDLVVSSIHPNVARSFLFYGTKIIRARRPHDDTEDEAVALAMVLRTGFNTTKGSLVRSMLFPKPSGFTFYRDSFRYITVMAGIAMVGFFASLVNFMRLKLAWHLIIVRVLDLITIVVPPALPATLSIGITFALARLKEKQIFCISPQRVNVGGKVDVVCFDKTGTLTEDGLDVLGLRIVETPSHRFSDVLTDSRGLLPSTMYDRDPTMDYKTHKAALYAMATCHSLRVVDGKLIGDPLDLKMFEFTGWSFEEGEHLSDLSEDIEQGRLSPSVARPPPGAEYAVDENEPGSKASFEFQATARSDLLTVVVRRFGAKEGSVYVKGAPEAIKTICDPDSLPSDYEDLIDFYTNRGYRVIACATKHIPKLSWVKVQKLSRSEAESDLRLVGFIIFQNKLKPRTTGTIDELSRAGIRKIMCTGDNILTAISVARECNLIDRTAHCFVAHFADGGPGIPTSQLEWQSIDNPLFRLDDDTLKPLPPPAESDASLPYDISNLKNYSLALTGDVFRWIVDYAPQEILHRALVRGQIFARMSPDEKHELVEKLQSIGYCCGFCGDGANDCGALKAADVGISLSEAEASVAAPFTSKVFDISCVPEVIREGRAALVTSFSCFKYMSLYSAIQFTSVSFLYASASNLGDSQFLYIDLFLILPIAISMSRTGAYPVLSRKRPSAELVSRKVLTPLLGQIVLCILVQLLAFEAVRRQTWYTPPKIKTEESNILNSDNTVLFLISCFQYIFSAVVLNIGPPFRRSMLENMPFVVTIVVALLVSVYMLLDPTTWVQRLMELTFVSTLFKLCLLALALVAFACSWFAEKYLLPGLAKVFGRLQYGAQAKKRKLYKCLEQEMMI